MDKIGLKTTERIEKNLPEEQKSTLSTFEKALKKHKAKPLYARNEISIYGLSYQDKGKEFKASNLERGHSWNQIKDQIIDSKPNSLRENLPE